jgi:deoxynogalonate / 12-deoxyaklanonic acid monooxygenase
VADIEPTGPKTPVTFINRFTVHAAPEEFERTFAETSAFMATQDGYLGNTLLRHETDERSYVNIAIWRDADHFRQALEQPGFTPHARALRALSSSEPNLYQEVAGGQR